MLGPWWSTCNAIDKANVWGWWWRWGRGKIRMRWTSVQSWSLYPDGVVVHWHPGAASHITRRQCGTASSDHRTSPAGPSCSTAPSQKRCRFSPEVGIVQFIVVLLQDGFCYGPRIHVPWISLHWGVICQVLIGWCSPPHAHPQKGLMCIPPRPAAEKPFSSWLLYRVELSVCQAVLFADISLRVDRCSRARSRVEWASFFPAHIFIFRIVAPGG